MFVSRARSRWESFPGGNQAVSVDQTLRGFLARARAKLHTGGVEVGVDGLRGDSQALGDLLAAVALDHIAKAVPFPITQELGLEIG